MTRETIDLVEAAAALGMSYGRTYNLVLSGRLKGERLDGRWQVDLQDLKRLLQGTRGQARESKEAGVSNGT